MLEVQEDQLKIKLKEIFGFGQFRGSQEAIVKYILDGNDTFVIMPTGAGKSLCYQLPAVIKSGTAIIISPLIALMKNQVDQMEALGIHAKFLNSTLSKTEAKRVKKETLEEKIKLLYVAPESLTKEDNVEFLKQANISFVAVDEAHCISEWGHDFRPEYRKIKDIIAQLGDLPVIALTATATPKVQIDIQKNLDMPSAGLFKSSFNRENLYYEVRPKQNTKKQLIKFVKDHKGKSGIVYCLSRKMVEEIAGFLKVNDVRAAPYHAGLESGTRIKNQDDFLNENVDVIVATIAFGMGIDKPDVRFVIHYDVPKSLEGYYQETGRAGRDGLEGNCLMFFSHGDINKLEKFSKDKPVKERDNARQLLQEMTSFAESAVCRRRQLLHYFGESYDEDCGFCDNCRHPREKYEGQEAVQKVLKAVIQTEQRFGLNHIADVVQGRPNEYITSYGHDKLEIFGSGNTETDQFWRSVVRQALLFEFLAKDIDQIGVLKITPKGKDFIENSFSIELTKNHDYNDLADDVVNNREPMEGKAHDENLFAVLKTLRKDVARERNLPPYVIFQDPSLEEMATTYPTTLEELGKVNGVGLGKVQKFGNDFVGAIAQYVEDNDIITASDVVVKSAVNKSRMKVFIIQQIDKKVDLEEIAELKMMSMHDILDEIESIIFSGTKLHLDYYIDQILDEHKQEDLYEYYLNAESDSIEDALEDEENADYSEDELRLMRIKFLSEYAN